MQLLLTVLAIVVAAAALLALFSAFIARKVTQAFPPEGQFMEVEGERLHYRVLGDGPPLVLVHGLAGQMKNFDYLPLADLARRYRLVLVDRPGSGRSPRREDARAGISAQAQLIAAFIRALRLPQRPLLVGHSLGGAISLGVALHDPDCIAGLALIAPLTHFTPVVPEPFRALAIRTPWLRRVFAQVLAMPLAIATAKRTLGFVFAPEEPPRDFPVRGGGLLGLRPIAFYAASTDLVAVEHDLPAQQQHYGELRVPVHVLYGEGDHVLDWRAQGQALCDAAPGAQLRLIPGGHMIPVTQPATTAAWLEEAAQATFAGIGQHSAQ